MARIRGVIRPPRAGSEAGREGGFRTRSRGVIRPLHAQVLKPVVKAVSEPVLAA